MEGDKQLNYLQ